jgi:hypothetical protein
MPASAWSYAPLPYQDDKEWQAAMAGNWMAVLSGMWVDTAGLKNKMQRVYVRKDRRFVPVGWICE